MIQANNPFIYVIILLLSLNTIITQLRHTNQKLRINSIFWTVLIWSFFANLTFSKLVRNPSEEVLFIVWLSFRIYPSHQKFNNSQFIILSVLNICVYHSFPSVYERIQWKKGLINSIQNWKSTNHVLLLIYVEYILILSRALYLIINFFWNEIICL